MGKYSIIAEISDQIIQILKAGLIPELRPDESQIGLCSPDERGDYTVGVYLYDIALDSNVRISGMQNVGFREQSFPPLHVELNYMIMVRSASDLQHRSIAEHRLLGRILQLMYDNNTLSAQQFGGSSSMDMRIDFYHPERSEVKNIWTNDKEPYRTCLFYKVAPVEIESERRRSVSRVTDVSIKINEGDL